MARRKSIASIETKIEESKSRIERLDKRLANEKQLLADLLNERGRTYANAILNALKTSNKTIEQVMTFLGKQIRQTRSKG